MRRPAWGLGSFLPRGTSVRLCYPCPCNPSGWREQMTAFIGRREFITLVGGAIAGLPLAARAQQSRLPVLGFLASASQVAYTSTAASVRKGLNEAGYVEKQNLLIEYRWADFQYERLPTLAAELAK